MSNDRDNVVRKSHPSLARPVYFVAHLWLRRDAGLPAVRVRAFRAAACTLALVVAAVTGQAVGAETLCAGNPVPAIAASQHVGTFDGKPVRYSVTVRPNVVHERNSNQWATLVTISYVREDVQTPARLRPVIFAFNGGPGAASTSLNFGGFGPVLKEGHGSKATFKSNSYSLLDVTDLVYIDPVGTGFSRPCDKNNSYWYAQDVDADSVFDVIRSWLARRGRLGSPVFLFGESYGTMRVATMLQRAGKTQITGIILDGLYVPRQDASIETYITDFPTMAAAAWFHKKVDRGSSSVEQWFNHAVEFANTTYVTALVPGAALDAVTQKRVATEMSKLIGIPEMSIEADHLRVSKRDFMFSLLKDARERTGMLDTRVVAPLKPGEQGGIDDPALGVVKNYSGRRPITPAEIGPVADAAVGNYIHDALGFKATPPYYSINFTANSKWKYDSDLSNSVSQIGAYIKAHPHLRVMDIQGIYDLTTPAYSALYALRQNAYVFHNLDKFVLVPGPHAAYEDDGANLKVVSDAVRSFVNVQ